MCDGIRCTMYLAVYPEAAGVTGEYFHDNCRVGRVSEGEVSQIELDEQAAEEYWSASLALLALTEDTYGKTS